MKKKKIKLNKDKPIAPGSSNERMVEVRAISVIVGSANEERTLSSLVCQLHGFTEYLHKELDPKFELMLSARPWAGEIVACRAARRLSRLLYRLLGFAESDKVVHKHEKA